MVSKSSKPRDISELHDYVVKHFDEILSVFKRLGMNTCFDCGKPIRNKNSGGVLLLDGHGALLYCNSCTWKQISTLEKWRKILGTKPKGRW